MPARFVDVPGDICVTIRRLCETAMAQALQQEAAAAAAEDDEPKESSALHFFLLFEDISSRIEDARELHICHGYDALMDFLLEVDTFEKFTDTMQAEYSE